MLIFLRIHFFLFTDFFFTALELFFESLTLSIPACLGRNTRTFFYPAIFLVPIHFLPDRFDDFRGFVVFILKNKEEDIGYTLWTRQKNYSLHTSTDPQDVYIATANLV